MDVHVSMSGLVTVTKVLVVLEFCSHLSWMGLKDKATLGVGLRPEAQRVTRIVDAATHGLATYLYRQPGHLIMFLWHITPFYVRVRQQYGRYMNLVDAVDMLTYAITLYLHVGLTSWEAAVGVAIYLLAKFNRMMY